MTHELRCWYDGSNWAIAVDAAGAAGMIAAHLGDDPPEDVYAVRQLEVIAIWCEPNTLTPCAIGEGTRVQLTAAEWINAKGTGYLASEDA